MYNDSYVSFFRNVYIFQIQKEGHKVECLVSIFPESEESLLLHYPNIEITKLQAQSLNIPQIFMKVDSSKSRLLRIRSR